VALQDAALLYSQHPDAGIFRFAPFSSPAFHVFAASSASRIEEVERAARMAFENLPDHLVRGLRSALASVSIEHQKSIDENKARFDAFHEMLSSISGAMQQVGSSRKPRQMQSSVPSMFAQFFLLHCDLFDTNHMWI
jgi:hypothetical protein